MVEAKLKRLLHEHFGIDDRDIALTKTFIDDFRLDSLDLVELVMFAEEEFGIEIPDSTAETLLTFGDAVRFLEKELAS